MMNYTINVDISPDGKEVTTILLEKEDGGHLCIPTDPANSDYIAYLESLNDDTETE
jgi:hypothetical protein